MKFGVITFPGSNCDHDMIYVLETIYGLKVERLWHKDTDLKEVDMVILPGGFSYGDYLRSGSIAQFSPIMKEVISFAKKGGYVLGVCNGFQVLCETGLLDGALLHNISQKFICKNTFIKPASQTSAITKDLNKDQVYKIPIAHGEGRFYAPEDTLKKIHDQDSVLFHYTDVEGKASEESNPNGSLYNIAGVTNKNKNIFGMMPHPERAADEELHNTDGKALFDSLLAYMN